MRILDVRCPLVPEAPEPNQLKLFDADFKGGSPCNYKINSTISLRIGSKCQVVEPSGRHKLLFSEAIILQRSLGQDGMEYSLTFWN